MIKRKNAPKTAKKYELLNKNPDDLGMVNLSGDNDINDNLKDIVNLKLSNSNKMIIYFPIFENSYVKEFNSKNGFTIKKIIKSINLTGIKAFAEDWKMNPDNYHNTDSEKSASDAIGEYAITDLFYVDKNNVLKLYVNLEH